ncbi:MAG TPA: ectoine/hydroxyectoine ABC transporter permease subunit EhuC [Gammaproteobacteria bacterium]|nr:ectoine/hydroxyectoine ABC transporter permease subunit EhuC [Gammaproteobacteria bacterium]
MDTLSKLLPSLLQGLEVTVWITLASTLIGALLSFAAGIAKISRSRVLRLLAGLYIEVFRGTSLLVQLFWLYYALPVIGLRLSPEVAGVAGLSLNIGAYGAEVVRGAILAVDPGQYEAATALNFTPRQSLWRILLPQAVVEMMPTFANLAIQNLKDSALVSLISLVDLTFKAEQLRNLTLETVPILGLTLLLYFVLALLIASGMRFLERRLALAAGREGTR